jgi:hypothetical protein
MKVYVYIEFNDKVAKLLQGIETVGNLIEWSCPALPRKGEYFYSIRQFLSKDSVAILKKTKAEDVFHDPEGFYGEDSLYELYGELGDRFKVGNIEWTYDDVNGNYPIINIMEE